MEDGLTMEYTEHAVRHVAEATEQGIDTATIRYQRMEDIAALDRPPSQ